MKISWDLIDRLWFYLLKITVPQKVADLKIILQIVI